MGRGSAKRFTVIITVVEKRLRNLLYSLGNKQTGSFGIPNSMRDVETPLGIYLRKEDD